jgi:hypothetical protein
MKPEIGKKYWVLTHLKHSKTIGKPEWEALKYLECNNSTMRMDDGLRFYFDGEDINGNPVSVQEWEFEQLIFKSPNEYLSYMVKHIDNLNSGDYGGYTFDDYFIELIKKSQEENPEAWV